MLDKRLKYFAKEFNWDTKIKKELKHYDKKENFLIKQSPKFIKYYIETQNINSQLKDFLEGIIENKRKECKQLAKELITCGIARLSYIHLVKYRGKGIPSYTSRGIKNIVTVIDLFKDMVSILKNLNKKSYKSLKKYYKRR